MSWFQSWSRYRCYDPIGGGGPGVCEHHVEYGPPGLVMIIVLALALFLLPALLITRRAKTDRS